jgi:hypothetical protein
MLLLERACTMGRAQITETNPAQNSIQGGMISKDAAIMVSPHVEIAVWVRRNGFS